MHLVVVLVLSALVALSSAQSIGVPVASYFKDSTQAATTVTVGQTLSSSLFLKNVKDNIEPDTVVDVIAVDQLKDEDIRSLIKTLNSVHYQPSVESAYQTLNDNLKNIKLTKAADAADAVALFKEKIASGAAVILTGVSSGIDQDRVKRDTYLDGEKVPDNTSTAFNVYGNGCAATFSSVTMINQTISLNSDPLDLQIDSYEFTCTNSSAMLTIQFTNVTDMKPISEIVLNFEIKNLYWGLGGNTTASTTGNAISYTLQYMGTPYGMDSPLTFSYVCTKSYFLLLTTDAVPKQTKVALYINNFQIQAFGVGTGNSTSDYVFGKLNYCQGFFSNGIWMAIISTLLMLIILMGGVVMLAGINTMDRFDDPKGKQLQIAQEK